MRILATAFLLLISIGLLAKPDPVTKIAKANKAKIAAEKAFKAGDYQEAVNQYSFLLDSLEVKSDEALLNRAHAYYHMDDTTQALTDYTNAALSSSSEVKSLALNQLGVIYEKKMKQDKLALNFYKEGLRANPRNETIRYNYELLKKKLEKKEEEKKDQDQQDQDNQQQEPSDYAKKLKKQAEQLVAQRKYKEAFELMQEGLKQDETVGYFKEFIQRIKDVTEII